ncbi:MAG TPA: response regulator transcription factor [Ktedonobacterales bacterium]|jgi:two-component system KDP operon response regulator KdpE|nr:response regulator transcription factor [Ktedonobacterales bacterium]
MTAFDAAKPAGSHKDETTDNELPQDEVGRRRGAGARVLVIDDEPEIGRAVRLGLRGADFTVEWAATGAAGMERVAQWRPDVILLDLSLPDIDGVEVCKRLRRWTQTPIIVLSVRAHEADKVAALEHGADDYLTKPFSMVELIARIRVALRHAAQTSGAASGSAGALVRIGELELDLERRLVTVSGQPVHLTPTEYEVLKYLAANMGKVVTHSMLLHAVWGPSYEAEAHYLRVFINQLRRKIEPDPSRPRYLITEPGIGYRLRETQ